MPTQKKNVTGDPFGIEYAKSGLTWTVNKGVKVKGAALGVYSEYGDSTLINKGRIVGDDAGAILDGDYSKKNLKVTNKKSGVVMGEDYGVILGHFGNKAEAKNDGKIISDDIGLLFDGTTAVTAVNNGKIVGRLGLLCEYNSFDAAGPSGTSIRNGGTIVGTEVGIMIGGADFSVTATIKNLKGGIIEGGEAAIVAGSRAKITNEGKIKGHVVTSAAKDTVVNKGTIAKDVLLGDGNDTFQNKGNAKAGLIDGGRGNDTISLGSKSDKILFSTELDADTNVDRVKHFKSGSDKILLNEFIFDTLPEGQLSKEYFRKGTGPADDNDFVIYDRKSGKLYYDHDGKDGDGKVLFAKFDPGTKLNASDFKVDFFGIGEL